MSRESFYKEAGDYLHDKTFDIAKDDLGSPDIWAMIAYKWLQDSEYTVFEISDMWNSLAKRLATNIGHIQNYIFDGHGKNLYLVPKIKDDGLVGRPIRIVTTDPDYELAQNKYIAKKSKRMGETCTKTVRDIEKLDRREAKKLKHKTIRMLSK